MKRFYTFLTVALLALAPFTPAGVTSAANDSNISTTSTAPAGTLPDVCTNTQADGLCPSGIVPPPKDVPSNQHQLSAITFALQEAQGRPRQAASRFVAGTPRLYAFFNYDRLSDADVLSGVWYRGGHPLLRQSAPLTEIFGDKPPSSATVWFTAALRGGFPAGVYRLVVSVNQRVDQVGEFWIEPSDGLPVLTDLTFARSVNAPEDAVKYPIDAASQFAPNPGQAYAVFDYFDMTQNTQWGWRLSRDGVTVNEAQRLRWASQASGTFALPFALPAEPGLYDLDLFVNQRWVQADSFVIGNASPAGARLLEQDDFQNPASGWTLGKDHGGQLAYSNDHYVITLNSLDPYWGTSRQVFHDFVLQADAAPLSRYGANHSFDGPTGDAFGLVVRAQDNKNFYAFLIGTDGRAGAFHMKDGEIIWDIPWTITGDDVVNASWQTAHLRALVKGSELRFYVNDRLVARVPDAIWSSGTDGLIATNAYGGTFNGEKVAFSHWRVWSLPIDSAGASPDVRTTAIPASHTAALPKSLPLEGALP